MDGYFAPPEAEAPPQPNGDAFGAKPAEKKDNDYESLAPSLEGDAPPAPGDGKPNEIEAASPESDGKKKTGSDEPVDKKKKLKKAKLKKAQIQKWKTTKTTMMVQLGISFSLFVISFALLAYTAM